MAPYFRAVRPEQRSFVEGQLKYLIYWKMTILGDPKNVSNEYQLFYDSINMCCSLGL